MGSLWFAVKELPDRPIEAVKVYVAPLGLGLRRRERWHAESRHLTPSAIVPGVPTHSCPIDVVKADPTSVPLVDGGWCFDAWADRVAGFPPDFPESAWPPPNWTLYRDGGLEVVYAPFDWTNEAARVALVGITPGRHQGWVASVEAGAALRDGASREEALRRADRVASFSGPMRRNLVGMFDMIGLADQLGIASCDALFGESHDLATHLSALAFPVFVNGRNYTGANITRNPALVSIIRQVLAGQLVQATDALVVPLGNAAAEAVGLLVSEGVLDAERCLLGFPHPSGANGHRKAQFEARRAALSESVVRWGNGGVPDQGQVVRPGPV